MKAKHQNRLNEEKRLKDLDEEKRQHEEEVSARKEAVTTFKERLKQQERDEKL